MPNCSSTACCDVIKGHGTPCSSDCKTDKVCCISSGIPQTCTESENFDKQILSNYNIPNNKFYLGGIFDERHKI